MAKKLKFSMTLMKEKALQEIEAACTEVVDSAKHIGRQALLGLIGIQQEYGRYTVLPKSELHPRLKQAASALLEQLVADDFKLNASELAKVRAAVREAFIDKLYDAAVGVGRARAEAAVEKLTEDVIKELLEEA